MKESSKNFEDLIDKDKYQVFLFCCSIYLFAKHPWFVLNKKGDVSRWEVRHYINDSTGLYLHKNNQPPFQGIEDKFFGKEYFYKASLIKYIEGDEGSVPHQIIQFIENSVKNYPYCNKYNLILGPNSNSYAQWILDNFPEFNVKLSWKFIGKGFKVKK